MLPVPGWLTPLSTLMSKRSIASENSPRPEGSFGCRMKPQDELVEVSAFRPESRPPWVIEVMLFFCWKSPGRPCAAQLARTVALVLFW